MASHMIKNTFLHIPDIGSKTEQRLWQSGIHSWDDFTPDCPVRFPQPKIDRINAALEESRHHFKAGDPDYFSDKLPANQLWRLFPDFRGSTAFIDVQKTGMKRWGFEITTIALYDGQSISFFVNEHNIDDFPAEISKYSVIVTHSGKTIGTPLIEEHFGITLDQAHIDLRYILTSLGYTGGLDICKERLGIDRGDCADISGYSSVLFWYDYLETGNKKALETLLSYGIQEAVNLETLMVMAYNMKINDTPFHQNQLPEPVLPVMPFEVDKETVDRINREHGFDRLSFEWDE